MCRRVCSERGIPVKRNTVHLTILMHSENSTRTWRQAARERNGKLLILRFTPRGLRRPRLDTTRSCKISANTRSWNAFLARGGNSAVGGQFATNHPNGVQDRQPVREWCRG